MANGGRIDFTVGLKTDKSSLNQLNKTLQTLQNSLNFQQSKNGLSDKFQQASKAAKNLQTILNEAWNSKLGQLNLDKVNVGIKKSYNSVNELRQALNGAGADGRTAFNQLATEIFHANTEIKEGNALLNDFADTFGKTVKYGIASSIFNNIKNSLQQAFYFAKDLDLSLTNIRIVTGDSADQMERFAKTANQAAKDLGRSTLDYTNAALTFYQQGLGDKEVNARTQATMMAQNITGVGTQMADYLTAVWNGYKVSAEDAISYVDKLAAVADSSASDMSQLAVAMSKVASAANVMGVDADQLNAQLATVIATTREAPQSIGTAFKTIYARINDIKAGADDAEVSLGNYSGAMASLGFNVFDTNGKLRDTGDVIEEVGGRWQELSREQQIYLARTMGGTRQYSRLISLFDNWTMYSDMLNVSLNSEGTLLEKNGRYMDSVKAHMEKLNAETERMYDILADTDSINGVTTALTKALNVFNDFIEGLGGGLTAFSYFGSFIVGIFNKQIAGAVDDSWQKIKRIFNKKKMDQFINQMGANVKLQKKDSGDYDTVKEQASTVAANRELEVYKRMLSVRQGLTAQQQKQYIQLQKAIGVRTNDLEILKQHKNIADQVVYNSEATVSQIEESLQENQKYLQSIRQYRSNLNTILKEYQKNGNVFTDYEQKETIMKQLTKLANNQTLSAQQRLHFQEIHTKLKSGEKITESDIADILAVQTTKQQNQEREVRQIIELLNIKKRVENGEIQDLEKELELYKQQEEFLNKQGQHSIKMQKMVLIASSIGQILSTAAGAAKVFWDKNSTGAEKANAAFSGLQGTISSIGMIFGTKGMIISTALNGILSIFKEIPLIRDSLESLFMTSAQAMQKMRKTFQETSNEIKVNRKGRAELEAIQEEYETLISKSGKLTDSEKTRLTQLAEKFATYSDDVITGYNLQGEAIVSKNAHIDEGLDKLDTEYEKIQRNARAQLDLKGLDKDYNKAKDNADAMWTDLNLEDTVLQSFNGDLNDVYTSLKDYGYSALASRFASITDEVQKMYNNAIANNDIEGLKIAQQTLRGGILGDEDTLGVFSPREDIKPYVEDPKNRSSLKTNIKWYQQRSLVDMYNTELFESIQDAVFKLIENMQENIAILQPYEDALSDVSAVSPEAIKQYIQGGDTYQNIRKSYSSQDWSDWGQELFSEIIDSISTGLEKTRDGIESTEGFGEEGQQILQDLVDNVLKPTQFKAILKKKDKQIQDTIEKQGFISIQQQYEILKKYAQQYFKGIKFDEIFNSIEDPQQKKRTEQAFQKLMSFYGLNLENMDFETSKTEIQQQVQAFADQVFEDLKKAQDTKYQEQEGDKQRLINQLLNIGGESFFAIKGNEKFLDFTDIEGIDDLIKKLGLLADGADDAEDSLSALSTDDTLKFFKLLSQGKSYSKIKGADKFVSDLEKEQPRLRELAIAKEKGRRDDEWISLATQTTKKLLQDQINETYQQYQNAIKALDNTQLEKGSLGYGALSDNVAATEDAWIAAKEALDLFVEGLKSSEDELEEQQTLLEKMTQKVQAYNKEVEIYNSLLSDRNAKFSDDQLESLLDLEDKYPRLAKLGDQDRHSREYRAALEEVLQLQKEQLLIEKEQTIQKEKQLELGLKRKILKEEEIIAQLQESLNNDTLSPTAIQAKEKQLEHHYNKLQGLRKSHDATLKNIAEDQKNYEILQLDEIQKKYETLEQMLTGYGGYYSKLAQGIALESDEYEDFMDLLYKVEHKYSDLGDVVNRVRQTWMSGTEQYATWVEELQNKLNTKSLTEAFGQIETDLNLPIQISDDFLDEWHTTKEDIESFFEDDKELSIRIDDTLTQDVDRLKDHFDQIYDAASKIGQNFIVKAQDIGLIEKVFPSITQGMNLLANGSYELNQQMVQQAMSTADAQVNASAQAMMEKIQNDIDYHNAKADIYHEMSELAYKMAGDEVISQKQAKKIMSQIGDDYNKLQQIDKKKVTEYQQNADDDLVKSTDSATDDMSNSFIEYFEGNVQASAEATNAEIDHMSQLIAATRAMQAGQDPSAMKITSNMGFLGHLKKQARKDAGQIPAAVRQAQAPGPRAIDTFNSASALFEGFTKKDWLNYGQKYAAREEQERASAAILQGLLSSVQGRANEVTHGLQNVAQGHGIEDPKEQKQKKEKEPAEPSQESYLKDEFDLYHDINIILAKIDRQLKNIQKDQQKLTGAKLAENYQQQLDLLNAQIAAQKEKIALAQSEAASLQGVLSAQGVAFNGDGTIANYLTALQSKENEVNAFIAYYNSLSKEEQDAAKGALDAVKQNYEDLKKNISKYDNLINEMIPDLTDQIKDELDKQVEIKIARFKMAVDIKMNLSQLTRDYNHFVKTIKRQIQQDDVLGNTAFAFKDLESYFLDGLSNSTEAQANHIKQTLQEIYQMNQTGMSDIYGQNKAQALKDLESYRKSLQGDLQSILNLINQIKENVLKAIDQVDEGFEKRNQYYEHITDLLNHDLKLVELIYGDKAYRKMDNLYKMQYKYDKQHLRGLAEEKEFWKNQLQNQQARQKMYEFGSQDWDEAEERIKKFEDNYLEATKNLNSAFEESLQNIIKKHQNGIKLIFSDLQKELNNGFEFETVTQQWEMVKRQADMHFDSVNKMFQIDKLKTKFQKALSETKGNAKAQREINALMEDQLKSLRENKYLRDYDVDRATKMLELQQKMLELEDARNNRTKLSLRRDSQGNYSYQYSADADDVTNKLQEIRDLKNEIYNLDLNQYRSDLDDYMDLFLQWQDKLIEADKLKGEEREQAINAINEKYRKMIDERIATSQHTEANLAKSTIISMTSDYDSFMNPDTGKLKSLYSDDQVNVQIWMANNQAEIETALNKIQTGTDNMLHRVYEQTDKTLTDINSGTDNMLHHVYGQTDKTLTDIDSISFTNFKTAFYEMVNNHSNGLVPIWDTGLSRMMEKIAGQGGFESVSNKAMEKIQARTEQYEQELDQLAGIAEVDTAIIGEGLNEDIYMTEQLIYRNQRTLNSYQDIFNEMMSYWIPTLHDFIGKHEQLRYAIDAVTDAYRLQREEYQRDIQAMQDMAQAAAMMRASMDQGVGYVDYGYTGGGYGGGGGYDSGGGYSSGGYTGGDLISSSGGTPANTGSIVEVFPTVSSSPQPLMQIYYDENKTRGAYNAINSGSVGNDPYRTGNLQSMGYSSYGARGQEAINNAYLHGMSIDDAIRAASVEVIYGYATGGYTGTWNNTNGRLAFLHQKELVLNQQDTQNILDAVGIVRNLTDSLNHLTTTNLPYTTMFGGNNGDKMIQQVHISADFPNVQSHKQIEMAFQNLTNRASQYLFSNR